jgi:hypothetical protein
MGDQPARDRRDIADAVMGRAGLATQLRELEAFVARSEMEGGELPGEAIEMIARLREIVQALDELTASMTDPGQQPPHEGSPTNDS